MSERMDPVLARLFDESKEELPEAHFLQQVEQRITRQRRRTLLTRCAIIAAILLLEILLDSPVRYSVTAFSDALSTTLYQTENQWLDYVLAPVNSLAGLLGGLLVGAHALHRRLRG